MKKEEQISIPAIVLDKYPAIELIEKFTERTESLWHNKQAMSSEELVQWTGKIFFLPERQGKKIEAIEEEFHADYTLIMCAVAVARAHRERSNFKALYDEIERDLLILLNLCHELLLKEYGLSDFCYKFDPGIVGYRLDDVLYWLPELSGKLCLHPVRKEEPHQPTQSCIGKNKIYPEQTPSAEGDRESGQQTDNEAGSDTDTSRTSEVERGEDDSTEEQTKVFQFIKTISVSKFREYVCFYSTVTDEQIAVAARTGDWRGIGVQNKVVLRYVVDEFANQMIKHDTEETKDDLRKYKRIAKDSLGVNQKKGLKWGALPGSFSPRMVNF